MKDSWKVGDAELDIIKKNCTLSPAMLKEMIKSITGMDVSEQGINYHLKRIRENAEISTKASSAIIDAKVSKFVDININDYLSMLDNNIRRIDRILREEDETFKPTDKEGHPSNYYYVMYSRLLGEQIGIACELRPQIEKVEVTVDSEASVIDKMKKYEEVFKKD